MRSDLVIWRGRFAVEDEFLLGASEKLKADLAKDARARAGQIASQGSREVKELRSARMGVVQINPVFSTATSWEGNNDTSSLDKTMTVSAIFALR